MEKISVNSYGKICKPPENRDIAIDIAKAVGILLVVLGHYDIPKCLNTWIFSFHMPLFIFLSGYVWKRSLKSIVPMTKNWLIAGFIGCIIYLLKERNVIYFINQLFGVLLGSAAPYYRVELNPAIWFLSCLIFIQLLAWCITNKKNFFGGECMCVTNIVAFTGSNIS